MITSPSGITFSHAEREDASAILELQKLAYRSEAILNNDFSIPPLLQTIEELLLEFDHQSVLKAEQGGRIVGSVRVRVSNGVGYIGRLIVHPDLQGMGIGLLRQAEMACGEVAYWELFTGAKSERNLRLYRRHGYAQHHMETLSGTLDLVFMRKSANPALSTDQTF